MFTDAPIGIVPHYAPAARRRSEETWAAARDAYLGGQSGPQVCERFGVGLSALRQRAAREDWRRSDQADPAPAHAPETPPEDLDADPDLNSADLAALAFKRARRAMLEERPVEAQRWTRLYASWRKLAAEDAEAAERAARAAETPEQRAARAIASRDHNERLDALLAADRTARQAARAEADDPDEAHDLHDLHASPETQVAPPNRQRRRALARLEALKARQETREGRRSGAA